MKRYLLTIVIITLVYSVSISAKELPYIYKGARPLGMGGAFVAVSDDANALFYNPAGLADIKETRISPLNLQIDMSHDAYKFYKDALKIDLNNDQEVSNFLREHIGDSEHIATSYFPYYVRPNLAFGLISSVKSNFQVRDKQYPILSIDAVEDIGACVGYAHSLLNDNLLIGSNLKYLYRRSLEDDFTIADITTNGFKDRLRDEIQHGSGVLLDLGIIYKFKDFTLNKENAGLQVGVSANNLIGNKLGNAEDMDSHIDIGVSSHVRSITLAADYVDILGQLGNDKDTGKRIHLGLEYTLTKIVALRTGLYQGYPTFGVGIRTRFIQFDALSYAEEVGTASGQNKDRRYLLNMAVGF